MKNASVRQPLFMRTVALSFVIPTGAHERSLRFRRPCVETPTLSTSRIHLDRSVAQWRDLRFSFRTQSTLPPSNHYRAAQITRTYTDETCRSSQRPLPFLHITSYRKPWWRHSRANGSRAWKMQRYWKGCIPGQASQADTFPFLWSNIHPSIPGAKPTTSGSRLRNSWVRRRSNAC